MNCDYNQFKRGFDKEGLKGGVLPYQANRHTTISDVRKQLLGFYDLSLKTVTISPLP